MISSSSDSSNDSEVESSLMSQFMKINTNQSDYGGSSTYNISLDTSDFKDQNN